MSSDSPYLDEDDLESTYYVEDVGDPLGSLNKFLDKVEVAKEGPYKIDIGKGKQLRFCDKIIQERATIIERGEIDEDGEDENLSDSDGEEEVIDHEAGSNHVNEDEPFQGEVHGDEGNFFQAYDPNYTSPRGDPYSQTIDANEVDFEYDPKDTKKRRLQ